MGYGVEMVILQMEVGFWTFIRWMLISIAVSVGVVLVVGAIVSLRR